MPATTNRFPALFNRMHLRALQEEERDTATLDWVSMKTHAPPEAVPRFAVVGAGRLGHALIGALDGAGASTLGPLARGAAMPTTPVVILCVPESALAEVSAMVPAGAIVGHCSASAPLDLLAPHERFVAHPLMTFAGTGARFAGATCAIDGSTPRALGIAAEIVRLLDMRPVQVPAERRTLYHAAASVAANFLVTLEAAAERLAAPCGIDRAALAPLVRAAVEHWAELGPAKALTGPIARGDEPTVAKQRAAVADVAPDLLPLWDALANATRAARASS